MRVGILGGGQLARMLILAGTPLGVTFTVWTSQISPTTALLARHVVGPYEDKFCLAEFTASVDVVTYETENIPTAVVDYINHAKPVYPGVQALAVTQDRLLEKQLFREHGIPTNDFYPVDTPEDLKHAARIIGFPFILKTRCNGYDGKYHYHIRNESDMHALTVDLNNTMAEAWVAFDREISVLATRGTAGDIVWYDTCENHHDHGILRMTLNRPEVSSTPLVIRARAYVKKIMEHFHYVGTMALEWFVQGEQLFANEIAPRVHNSGHWTINGCKTSQFENHVRAISGLPLGDPQSWGHFGMCNIISEWPDRAALLRIPGLALHDYVKIPQPGRKLGHITMSLLNKCGA